MKGHLFRRLGVLTLAGVLAITVGGSAAAHPDSSAAPKAGFTLTVGTTLSLTGDGAVFGPAFQKSAELAVDLANKALVRDGVKDITVKIDSTDDGSTPTSAVNAARKLCHADSGPRRFMVAEVLRVDLVYAREVGHVGQVYGAADRAPLFRAARGRAPRRWRARRGYAR